MRGIDTATTFLNAYHIRSCGTIPQSLSDCLDYGMNPEKTLDGALIRAYECDPVTADAELLSSKEKYQAITGREQMRKADVLGYQIRQSFPPGKLSPEEALADGYETAMRWTREKHAFFVAPMLTDHTYVHMYCNSTSLDCAWKADIEPLFYALLYKGGRYLKTLKYVTQ